MSQCSRFSCQPPGWFDPYIFLEGRTPVRLPPNPFLPPTGSPVFTSSVAAISLVNTPSGVVFPPYTVTAVNSPTDYSVANLPEGLSFNKFTQVLSGTIPAGAVYNPRNITLIAKNSAGSSFINLPLFVSSPSAPPSGTPEITSDLSPIFLVNTSAGINFPAYTVTTSPASITVTAVLPSGLVLDPVTRVISGTILQGVVHNPFDIQLLGTNSAGTGPIGVLPLYVALPLPPPRRPGLRYLLYDYIPSNLTGLYSLPWNDNVETWHLSPAIWDFTGTGLSENDRILTENDQDLLILE